MKDGSIMSEQPIPFIKPHFPDPKLIANDYAKIVESNWFTNFGPYENELCRQIENFIDKAVHVTTVANATLGIELAIKTLFKKNNQKKQIIVPSFTFIAGPASIVSAGFVPVFIDINASLQPDLQQAKRYIVQNKDKVAGIFLCNIFGVGNKEIGKWESFAKKHNFPLIIDSAAGFGSMYDNREYIGSRGDCEIFSMHATKPFSVGEGGLVVSKNADVIKEIRHLQNFGFDQHKIVTRIGTNAKLQELNCAIGIRQLEDFTSRLDGRRQSLLYYKSLLTKKGFTFQENDEFSTVAFVSALAPNSATSRGVYEYLLEKKIEIKKYYAPIHFMEAMSGKFLVADTLKYTEDVARRIVSLPLHDYMDIDTIRHVVDAMNL